MVRALAMLPGAKQTALQIERHAAYWRTEASVALASIGPVVVVLGDSLAQGVGVEDIDSSYPLGVPRALDASAEPMPILNLSRSGARIQDVLNTQLPALEAADVQPSIVMCTIGSNDLLRSVRLSRQRRQMGALLAVLPAGALVATLPAAGSVVARRFNRWLRAEAPGHDIVVADVDRLLPSWRGLRARDGFHPNEDGYTRWVQAFTAAVAERDQRPSLDPPTTPARPPRQDSEPA